MNTSRFIQFAGLAMLLLGVSTPAPAQEYFEPVDSIATAVPQALRPESAQLTAAELEPLKIDLPPTVVPPDIIEKTQRRASDLNGDGKIDQADAVLLQNSFGPCVAGQTCAGDLDGDGVVNESDVAILQRHIGSRVSGHEAQAERVGSVFPAPLALIPPLPERARADGHRVIKLELRSINARGLRLQFSHLRRAATLEIRFYDPATGKVVGPYISPHPSADGTWWGPTIFGDTIGVELTLRADARIPAMLPEISSVGYLFCDGVQCSFPAGNTMSCHNDVTCFSSWANAEGRAVALIYFVSGSGCARCTGALMNRGPGDLSPLFATAHHCISTQAEADSVDFIWFFDTASCNGSPPSDGTHNLGSLLLKRHPGSDETLLGLYEQPASNYYIGSNANSWSSGDSATGVHHPRGTFKKISFGSSDGNTDGALFCDPVGTISCTCSSGPNLCIAADVWDVAYTSGTTEPGSSGSPIFDSSRRMRGTLTGGPASCPNVTMQYGRFDRAYANLRYYIDNASVPAAAVIVNGGVAGDPGNAGSSERGTSGNPFNTVREATYCVRSGNPLQIVPAHYNESMTIWRPMTLQRSGASGTVVIGAP